MTNQEINEQVARKLGGERRTLPDAVLQDGTVVKHYPDYCGSIQAAWELVEKMPNGSVGKNLWGDWICSWGVPSRPDGSLYIVEHADTASMAICKAFLKL